MAQEKKYDVFISSKSEDYPIAEKVYDFLVDNGLTVFLASRELRRIGEAEYSEAVDAAIDGSHHMVISGDAFNDGTTLPVDVPVKMRIEFQGISEFATEISMLNIALRNISSYHYGIGSVTFRNIPIYVVETE